MNPSRLVEELISTVARAFYDDTTVIILDALVHEKFIRDEELGPRLKLPNKEVKRIVTQLEIEQLVSYEDLTMEDLQTSRCWYIDYRKFMLMAHYRVYLMQKEIQDMEKRQSNRLFFECPTCHQILPELEAMRLIGKDLKSFICPHCCPYRNIRDSDPEPYFTLVEYNNQAEMAGMEALKTKMRDQLSEAPNFHAGLFDILAQLKNIPLEELIRNKPSDNIKRGNINSKVTDADILKEIEENSKKMRGKPRKEGTVGDRDGDFSIEIVGEREEGAGAESADTSDQPPAKKQKSMPFFIGGSRVYGSGDPVRAGAAESGGPAPAAEHSTAAVGPTVDSTDSAGKGYRFGQSLGAEVTAQSSAMNAVTAAPAAASLGASGMSTGNPNVGPKPALVPTEPKVTEEEALQDLADIEWEE